MLKTNHFRGFPHIVIEEPPPKDVLLVDYVFFLVTEIRDHRHTVNLLVEVFQFQILLRARLSNRYLRVTNSYLILSIMRHNLDAFFGLFNYKLVLRGLVFWRILYLCRLTVP